MIYGDGGGIRIEGSLPKLLYGNNLSSVSNAQPALKRLREFTLDYVSAYLLLKAQRMAVTKTEFIVLQKAA